MLSTPKLNLDNKAAKMNLELKSPSRKRLPTRYNRLQTAKHARSSNVIYGASEKLNRKMRPWSGARERIHAFREPFRS